MKKIITTLFLCSCQIVIGQQQKIIDSLDLILKTAHTTTDSIKLLDDISWSLKRNNPAIAKKYALNGLDISNGNLELKKIAFYNTLGIIYRQTNEIELAILQYEQAILLSKKYNDQNRLATAHLNLGVLYKNISKKGKAILHYNLAEKAISFQEDSIKAGRILIAVKNNTANIYSENNEKLKALEIYKELEQSCIKEGLENELASIYNNIANIHKNDLNHEKSLEYHKKSLQYEILTNNKKGISISYSAISSVFAQLKQNDSSLYYIKKSIDLAEDINYVKQKCNGYKLLGEYYIKQKKYSESLPHFKKSLKIARDLEYQDYIINNLVYIAQCNLHTKKLQSVLPYLNEAVSIAGDGWFDFKHNAYDTYLKYYYSVGNISEVNKYSLLIKTLRDREGKLFRREKIQEIEVKYQTQQKENEILKLNNEKVLQEAALTKSRFTAYGILGALLLLLGGGYFFWNKRKQSHKLALLENTVKTSDAEKSRIGKELHDGIAGSIMKMVHDSETAQIQLSHKLLQTYNEVRSLSHQLDNTPQHGELFLDRVLDIIPDNKPDQKFNFNISPRHLIIEEPHGTHVFRIIQELITNNLKYANASETDIKLSFNAEILLLDYSDNGIKISAFKKGNGYKNIEARITLLNGTLKIKTENGFKVAVKIPYKL